MKTNLDTSFLNGIYNKLAESNKRLAQWCPGESAERQPVHTVYGGAHLFKPNISKKFGELALRTLDNYARNFIVFAKVLKLNGAEKFPSSTAEITKITDNIENNEDEFKQKEYELWLAYTIYNRVINKLKTEAVEDFRIDFEDGYGNRADTEEDEHAIQASDFLAKGMQENSLPPFIGIRIKPFTEELKERGIRTLDIFLTNLSRLTSSKLPENFVVTLPKVTLPEQIDSLCQIFEELEKKLGFKTGSLKMEIMIETTQSIINREGEFTIPSLIKAGAGRIRGAHFGTYDYTASCNITAAHQSINHPVCDFARNVMQVAFAGTGIMVSDGATTIMPIGPHRPSVKNGEPTLTEKQIQENLNAVHYAWKLAYDNICNSLLFGFYQGWDLNPGQLPIRYAAMYTFFLEGFEAASTRLKHFIRQAAQATLVGHMFDDAATGQGLLNYFIRALSCRAITTEEALLTGLSLEEIQSRSFAKIAATRRG